MDNGKQVKLERKLAAIKEIKQQEYVGTGKALGYLNRLNLFYDGLEAVVREINLRLGDSPKYAATRERVLGVCYQTERVYMDAINDIVDEMRVSPEDDDNGAPDYVFEDVNEQIVRTRQKYGEYLDEEGEFKFQETNPIVNWRAFLMGGFQKKVPDQKSLAEHLSAIFIAANNLDEPSDKQIGYIAVLHVGCQDDVPQDIFTLAKMASPHISWDEVLSETGSKRVESSFKSSLRDDYFSPQRQFHEMEYCHELGSHENRRRLLASKLETDIVVSPDGLAGVGDEWRRLLNETAQRRDELIGYHSPRAFIENHDKRIRYFQFLLRTLRQEEGYFRRYLGA
ncbi:hypothetical protein HYU14_00260 [Candidatus Woesearchaeota archaeon]|nr:hypothetical protein [Candidatus Woesearchaeota archaeon]